MILHVDESLPPVVKFLFDHFDTAARLHGISDPEVVHTWKSNRCVFSYEKAVCLSVRPSVEHVICDKTKETCTNILIPHERQFILVFDKKNDWWGDPFYLKFWVKLIPLERNRRFSVDIPS